MRMNFLWSTRTGVRICALGAIAGLSLVSACSGSVASNSSGGEGLPAGATQEDFVAAFADMDEITLTTQTAAPPGQSVSVVTEKYKAAVEAWSGGKIKIDITYSSGLAPLDRAPTAISDGTMDFGYVVPQYDPARFPGGSALATTSIVLEPSPVVGALQALPVLAEATYSTDDIVNEFEAMGLEILLPVMPQDGSVLACSSERSSLDELRGAQVRVSGEEGAQQVEALGATPVSMVMSEMFEGLQRGTVDCSMSTLLSADVVGFVPQAPHIVVDSESAFGSSVNSIVFNAARWQQLPTVARQLLHDQSRVLVEEYLQALLDGTKHAIDTAVEAGGQVSELDRDASTALQAENEALIKGVAETDGISDGNAFTQAAKDSADEWATILNELGYEDVSYNDFAKTYERDALDLEPYLDRLWENVMSARRPS
ncbi:hypothetical protein GON09_005113 [Rhodococcus sp. B50]|nr:hypothetical protein [Rhodococcus sp. B50]